MLEVSPEQNFRAPVGSAHITYLRSRAHKYNSSLASFLAIKQIFDHYRICSFSLYCSLGLRPPVMYIKPQVSVPYAGILSYLYCPRIHITFLFQLFTLASRRPSVQPSQIHNRYYCITHTLYHLLVPSAVLSHYGMCNGFGGR